MTVYKTPIKGKLGIRSGVSKRMCFGICCDSKKECMEELRGSVGYYDSLKWRFHVSTWGDEDMRQHEEFLKARAEERAERKKEREYRKECFKWVEENKILLKDEFLKRLEEKSWINIKVKREALKQWLSMPERRKE